MKITLGFSPCPNDTFIFDALVNKKIDTGNFEFDVVLEDVETLNRWALEGKLMVTKLSFPAFFHSLPYYRMLFAGAAIGKGVGPLLITKKNEKITSEKIATSPIILPGENTTAHFLFSYAFPDAMHKIFLRFDSIENYIIEHPEALGVIIHENRFTYKEKGLHKIVDLGEYWEQETKLPIPLGGIAIQQSIDKELAIEINYLVQKSIAYSFENYPAISDYVQKNAQAMQEDVMRQHIELYVNHFTHDLGPEGQAAIEHLYEVYATLHREENKKTDTLFIRR